MFRVKPLEEEKADACVSFHRYIRAQTSEEKHMRKAYEDHRVRTTLEDTTRGLAPRH